MFADDDVAPPLDFRMALVSIGAFWTLYFVTVSGRAIVFHAFDGTLIANHAIVASAGAALTLALHGCMRVVDRGAMGRLVAAAFLLAIPITVAFALINHATFYVIAPLESVMSELAEKPVEHRDPVLLIFWTATSWYFFIVAWAVLYIALSYAQKVRSAEQRAARFRAQAQAAELRALRYQVKPAFLFNTLDALTALVQRGQFDAADQVLMSLSTFFRSSLTGCPSDDVSLADEVRMVELYVEVEKARLGDRLTLATAIPPELEEAALPGLVVQPLVEAATMNLATDAADRLDLTVGARADTDRLVVKLGLAGASPKPPPTIEEVAARLQASFGHAGKVSWSRANGLVTVELSLPLRR